jgi:hypothetical protein
MCYDSCSLIILFYRVYLVVYPITKKKTNIIKRIEQILLEVASCIVYKRVSFMFESKRGEYAEIKRLSLDYEA